MTENRKYIHNFDNGRFEEQKDWRIILRWFLQKWVVKMAGEWNGSGSCPVTGFGIWSVEPLSSAARVSHMWCHGGNTRFCTSTQKFLL
jgi:hypothetical protein